MRFYRYILIVTAVLLSTGCGVATPVANETAQIPAGKFYFYSKSCPHCASVETYLTENAIRQKFYFISRDVENDRTGYTIMVAVAKRCQLQDSEIAIPLFWDGTQCFVGDNAVISYFQNTVK
jgi:glutaredoxin